MNKRRGAPACEAAVPVCERRGACGSAPERTGAALPSVPLLGQANEKAGAARPPPVLSAEGVEFGGGGLPADGAGLVDRGDVGLPVLARDLGVGVNGAGCGGVEGEGGEAGPCCELAGPGGLGVEAEDAIAVFVAVLIGELGGELAGDGDLGAVEGGGAVGGADEGADDALQVDAHGRLVDGGLQELGHGADVLFGSLADAVEIDGIEGEGAADLFGLDGGGDELGDELQGDRLAGLRGAGGPGGGFLSVLCGHLLDLSTKTGGSRARCLLTASVRFVQAGQRRGLHP